MQKRKKIAFDELQETITKYEIEVEISLKDHQLLKDQKISLYDIMEKYEDLEYGESELMDEEGGSSYENLIFLEEE